MDLPQFHRTAETEAFARSVLSGLRADAKIIEPRWQYDAVGAKLFEAITNLDHYYPTRTELDLLHLHSAEIADVLGNGVTIVEPGSGEALKVRPLLRALGERATGFVPIDIAADQLEQVAAEMGALFPGLHVHPVAADFLSPFRMPAVDNGVVFFPGSTVGNMSLKAGQDFLRAIMAQTGAQRILVGFDLVKDRRTMVEAYDDPAGVTAAFKKNLLQRINRELGGTFEPSRFAYSARFNEATSSVEMILTTRDAHTVSVAGESLHLAAGEEISTGDSRKYTLESFAEFARPAGLKPLQSWTDDGDNFALMLLTRA